ncbi:unnamed protein product [Amaranthus hypochondriacus]
MNLCKNPSPSGYFCRKCNKVGHECKDTVETNQPQRKGMGNEEEKLLKDRKMWIPVTLANLVQGVSTIKELRHKVSTNTGKEVESFDRAESTCTTDHTAEDGIPTATNTALMSESEKATSVNHNKTRKNEDGGPWTPVAPGKIARRTPKNATSSSTLHVQIGDIPGCIRDIDNWHNSTNSEHERDGNPLIPSFQ